MKDYRTITYGRVDYRTMLIKSKNPRLLNGMDGIIGLKLFLFFKVMGLDNGWGYLILYLTIDETELLSGVK